MRSVKALHPEFAFLSGKWLAGCNSVGVFPFMTETLRPPTRQSELFKKGRFGSDERIVTYANAWESWHQFGLAFDFAFRPIDESRINLRGVDWNGPWNLAGAIAEECGLIWGGNWESPDRPHIEFHPGFIKDHERPLDIQMREYSEGYWAPITCDF